MSSISVSLGRWLESIIIDAIILNARGKQVDIRIGQFSKIASRVVDRLIIAITCCQSEVCLGSSTNR